MGPARRSQALGRAEFVVALSAYRNATTERAHVILPIAPFTETARHVREHGRPRRSRSTRVVKPQGEARPGWKVLRMLGAILELPGFHAETHRGGPRRIAPDLGAWATRGRWATRAGDSNGELRRAPRRRSSASPSSASTRAIRSCAARRRCRGPPTRSAARSARMNPATAAGAGPRRRRPRARAPGRRRGAAARVALDAALPEGCVRIARGVPETAALGEGEISLEKVAREARPHERAATRLAALGQRHARAVFGPAWGPQRLHRRQLAGDDRDGAGAAAAHGPLLPAGRALGDRLDPGAQGPEPRGLQGHPAAHRRRHQAADEGAGDSDGRHQGALPAGAGHLGGARAGGLGDRAVHARLGHRQRRRRRSW